MTTNPETDPTAYVEVLARLLCAADVHVHGDEHPTWQHLVGETGSRIRDNYRAAARWLAARLTVAPAVVSSPPATDRATVRQQVIDALLKARRPGLGGMSEADAVAYMADAVLAVLPPTTDRSAVLREEAVLIRAHCPDHLDSESAEGSWISCHCDVADDMERRVDEAPQPEAEPETPLEKRLRFSERRNDELRTECLRRGKTVAERGEKIRELEKQLDEVRSQLGAEILRAGQAENELRRLAGEPAEDPARIDRLRPEFFECASVEAIDSQIRRARTQHRRWGNRVQKLTILRQTRVEQKERGEWPAGGAGGVADETGEGERIVAYRAPVSNNLYCAPCGESDRSTPLTSDDLPDGGLCAGCGVDVLIPQGRTS